MLKDAITVELGLPGLVVLDMRELGDRIEVAAEYSNQEAECPRCRRPTWQVHQRSKQRKRDLRIWRKQVWLFLWKRRFRCRACRYVFTEDDPACGRRRRSTRRFRRVLASQAQEATVRAVSRWHGVSEGLVQRSWVEEYGQMLPPAKAHVFIGLDGFSMRRPGRMLTGMWDLQTKRPIGLTRTESQMAVQKLLERCLEPDGVKAVVIDLWEPFRQAIHMALPGAAIVADKFHIIAQANRALHEVRGSGRRRRGNLAWLLHRNVEHLSPADAERLAEALEEDDRLKVAWLLKEGLRSVYRMRTKDQAATHLDSWLREASASRLKPFERAARTLRKWREEVLNFWDYPLTNAMVEGKHNRIKVLKRKAYGYRNDRTLSLRFLNCFHTN